MIFNIEWDDVDLGDYPDFSDAYISYAEWEDGTPLTEEELENIDTGDYYDELLESLR